MTTQYPGALDGYAQIRIVADRLDEILAQDHNDLRSAVIAIESTLGLNPQGIFGTVVERLEDAYGSLQAHVGGLPPRHRDYVIESAVKIGSPYFSLLAGTVESQLEDLLTYVNGPKYGGSLPHKFDDGYFLPASRLDSAVTQLVARLGSDLGALAVGFGGTSNSFADGYVLPASSVAQAINQTVAQLGGTTGDTKIGTSPVISQPTSKFGFAGVDVRGQLQGIANAIEEESTILEFALSGFVISGMQVARLDANTVEIAEGEIAVNGRFAVYPGGSFVHSGVGGHNIYAVINVDGAAEIRDSLSAAEFLGANGQYPAVALQGFTETGAGWAEDIDYRRYGKWTNNQSYFTVGGDGYGADFTSLPSAIGYLTALASVGGGVSVPKKIVLVSDIDVPPGTAPVIIPSGFEIDGGNHMIYWEDDAPLFQGIDSSRIELKNIRAQFVGPPGSASSSFFKGLASTTGIGSIVIRNCKQSGPDCYKFVEFDDGGLHSIINVDVTECAAACYTAAFYTPPSSNPVLAARLSDNLFFQSGGKTATADACIVVGYNAIVTGNYLSGGWAIGISAGSGESTVIHGNRIDGGEGTEASPGAAVMTVGIQLDTPSADYPTRSIISDNIVKGTTAFGIRTIIGANSSAHTLISGNMVDNAVDTALTQIGISCDGDEDLVIGNYILFAGVVGIDNASHVVGNVIWGSQSPGDAAISVRPAYTRAIIADNYIKEFNAAAIAAGSGGLHQITGNYMVAPGGFGVIRAIDSTGSQCLIANNYIGRYGTGIGDTVVRAEGAWDMILNNYIENCKGIAFGLNNSSYSVVRGNYMVAAVDSESAIIGFGFGALICDNYVFGYGASVSSIIMEAASATSDRAIIANNHIYDVNGTAITLSGAGMAVVEGNMLVGDSNANTGIAGFGEQSVVNGNSVYGFGVGDGYSIIAAEAGFGTIISDNSVVTDKPDMLAGIALVLCPNCIIANNALGDGNTAGTPQVGIEMFHSAKCVVVGNMIAGSNAGGVTNHAIKNVAQDSIIANNYITLANYYGIHLLAAGGTVVSGNRIYDPVSDGIWIDTSPLVTAVGNYIQNLSTNAGIITANSSPQLHAIGNHVRDCGAGISLSTLSHQALVVGNIINNHTFAALEVSIADELTIVGNMTLNPDSGGAAYGCNLTGCGNTLVVGNRCFGSAGVTPAFNIDNTPANTLTAAGNLAHNGTVPYSNDGVGGLWSTGNNVDTFNCRHVGTP